LKRKENKMKVRGNSKTRKETGFEWSMGKYRLEGKW